MLQTPRPQLQLLLLLPDPTLHPQPLLLTSPLHPPGPQLHPYVPAATPAAVGESIHHSIFQWLCFIYSDESLGLFHLVIMQHLGGCP